MSSEQPETSEPQPTRAPDPRPARTRAAIKDAVARLAERPGNDMTVNAITREAGVSRSAFYDQFSDLDALAIDMLAEVFRTYSTVDTVALRAGTPAMVAATTATADAADITAEDRSIVLATGMAMYENRIGRALSRLATVGALDRPQRARSAKSGVSCVVR